MRSDASTLPYRVPFSEDLIRSLGLAADVVHGSRGCMFTFHRAAPSAVWETLPNRDFYLDLTFLDHLLSYLVRTGWAVVDVDEALRRARRGDPYDRYVNFSVDDCYRDTFEKVVPLFRRHKLPVTLFVTTGIPDGIFSMWNAGLEETLLTRSRVTVDGVWVDVGTSAAKRETFHRLATQWEGATARERYAAFCEQNGVDADALRAKHAITWDMLGALSRDPLVEIGAHTHTHARVSTLSPSAALEELEIPRERLHAELGVAARHFAFPYGRSGDCGPRDFALVRQAGYASAATTRKGLIRRGQDPFSLPRNTLNGRHRNLAWAELHLTGLTGAAARIVGRV